jgi:hypothetical protein
MGTLLAPGKEWKEMRKYLWGALVLALVVPVTSLADSWENVSLVDQMCSAKMKADPDAHPVSCALKCAASGYGIFTSTGEYLKLDKAGNAKALEALKATKKKDHIRANVTGELKGDTIQVASLTIPS